MNETIFLKIINREIPSKILYEDNLCMAILDISQVTKGHTLVFPKVKYNNIFDIDYDTLSHIIKVVKKISISLKEALDVDSVNIINNSGVKSGQSVNHIHFHIIPRYTNEEFAYKHENNINKYSDLELEELSKLIKNKI